MAIPELGDALSRWEPRLVANGIDVNDLRRVREQAGDWPGWFAAMMQIGNGYENLGRAALAAARRVTAGEHLVRAALYYHFAQFALFDFPALRAEGRAQQIQAFLAAAPLLNPPVLRFLVPYRGGEMPVHLRLATGSRGGPSQGRLPWVLLVPGLDSTKEEFHTFEALFLARGLAVATFDGPGQGEVAAAGRPWQPGDEAAVVAVVDALRQNPSLDPDRGALVGISFGGYLAPAAAALAGNRVRACAGIGGPFSLGDGDWDRLPPLIQTDFRHFCGAQTAEAARRVGREVCLASRLPNLQARLLLVHGTKDTIFPPDHAERAAAAAGSKGELVILDGGNHVCNNMIHRWRPQTADWVAEQLGR